jgi:Glycosyltransferase family 87
MRGPVGKKPVTASRLLTRSDRTSPFGSSHTHPALTYVGSGAVRSGSRTPESEGLVGSISLRTVGLGLCVAFALFMVWIVFFVVGPTIPNSFGFDARAYWGFPRDPIYAGPGTANGYTIYRYSPVFIPIMQLFTLIPWPVFALLWAGFLFAVYLWMSGRNWLPLLAFPPILFELSMGNIHLLLAAAVVLGFRWPAAWSFVLLTKVTPGIGLLWFAVRREWRSLAIALGVTLAIVAVGVVVAPAAWADWVRSLRDTAPSVGENIVAIPLLFRLVASAGLVVFGALTNRRWTVVVASTLALPTLWSHSFAMLVGIVALRRGMPERAVDVRDALRNLRLGAAAASQRLVRRPADPVVQ